MVDQVVVGAAIGIVVRDVVVSYGQLHIVRPWGIERVAHDRARARCVVVTEVPLPRNDFEIVRDR